MNAAKLHIIICFACIPLILKSQCSVSISYAGSLCTGTSITLTAIAKGTAPYSYVWKKDNSPVAGATKNNYIATSAGKYSVLITDKNGCKTSDVLTVNSSPPVSDFTVPATACANAVFNFSNVMPQGMESYSWDFGDGAVSSEKNPSHSFLTATGNSTQVFNIKLTVTDSSGCSASITKPLTVKQIPGASITDVSGLNFIHCITTGGDCNLTVNGTTSTSNTSYIIDWGDGTPQYNSPSLPVNLMHPYTNQGYSNITFTVTNSIGCSVVQKEQFFCGSNPAGGISNPGNTNGCAPFTITFPINGTDNNSPGTTYTITFNDTNQVIVYNHPPPKSITHTFTKGSCGFSAPIGDPNSFYVKLNISNPCSTTPSYVPNIHIGSKPVISFKLEEPKNQQLCVNVPSKFTTSSESCTLMGDGTVSPVVNYLWKIYPSSGWNAGSLSSSSLNVVFSQKGTFNITLIGYNSCGKDSLTVPYTVIESPEAAATPDFITNQYHACKLPFPVTFTNHSTPVETGLTYNWAVSPAGSSFAPPSNASSVNPVINFNKEGYYTVTLTASNKCGSDTAQFKIKIFETPTVNLDSVHICVSQIVDMADFTSYTTKPTISTYKWEIIPDTGWAWVSPSSSNSDYPKIVFNSIGKYTIKIKISGVCPSDSAAQKISVYPYPPAVITPKDTTICPDFPVTMYVNTGKNYSYQWLRNGNTISGATGTSYTTNQQGTYSCVVTSHGCSTESNKIKVTVLNMSIQVYSDSYLIINGTSTTLHGAIKNGSGDYSFYWSPSSKLANPNDSAINLNPQTAKLDSNTTFTLCVTDNFTGCKECKNVTINILGTILKVSLEPAVICFGQSIQIDAVATGGSGTYTYIWNTGESTPSITHSPEYSTTYSVTVNDGYNNVKGNAFIKVNPLPVVKISADKNPLCAGDTVNVSLSCNTCTSYVWNTGSASASFTSILNNSVTYSVTGTDINGCKNSESLFLKVNQLPLITITPSSKTICFGDSVTLDAAGGSSYIWSNGSSSPGITVKPLLTTVYTVTGTDLNNCRNIAVARVTVNPVPSADFSANRVCYGNKTVLNDFSQSTNVNISQWNWNFGDNSDTSYIQQSAFIIHHFQNPGVYPVKLTVTASNQCQNSIIKNVVVDSLPQADFTSDTVCRGMFTTFKDISESHGSKNYFWEWDFNDGFQGYVQNPQHYYTNEGVYNSVRLIVTNQRGCSDTVFHPVVVGALNKALFSANTACLHDTTYFINNSTGTDNLTEYLWDFGDGASSQLKNPKHLFKLQGIYFVRLTVKNKNKCSSDTIIEVKVAGLPKAGFYSDSGQNTKPIKFYDNSASTDGKINKWQWNFGDNSDTSYIQHSTFIIHNFKKPGYYNVSLIVTDTYGCSDTVVKRIQVTTIGITADFIADTVCHGSITHFTDASTIDYGIIDQWNWYFGDGSSSIQNSAISIEHLYKNPGSYLVTLIVFGSNTSDTIIKKVIVNPVPAADFSYINNCEHQLTQFKNLSSITSGNIISYNWNLGNGNFTNDVNPKLTYAGAGDFNITLIAYSDAGCNDTVSRQIKIYSVPSVKFTADNREGCQPLNVVFYDSSSVSDGIISAWYWTFGDNLVSVTGPQVSHLYDSPGFYDVSLKVTSSYGCFDSLLLKKYVNVYPKPLAGFIPTPKSSSVLHSAISFSDRSAGASSWLWDFGDNTFADTQSPSHNYVGAGNFSVIQYVKNTFECRDTASDIVNITKETSFFIPNAFTPSGDNKNDVFLPVGLYIDNGNFEMFIFNRWGSLIYKTDDINKGWDGKPIGYDRICPEGVYVWVIKIRDINGETHRYTGKVTLLKRT